MDTSRSDSDEARRRQLLDTLDFLDLARDRGLSALLEAAAAACGAPVSLMSIVTPERSRVACAVGVDGDLDVALGQAFCAHAICQHGVFEVEDASADPRFRDHPLVSGQTGIRFYAGAPVKVRGVPIGALSVLDPEPRSLDAQQRQTLDALARAAGELVSARSQDSSEERRQLASVIEATEVAIYDYDIPSGAIAINDRWAELIGYTRDELEPVHIDMFSALLHPDDQPVVQAALERHFSGQARDYECEVRMRHKDGSWVWILTRGRVLEWSPDREPLRMFGVHLDIRQRKAQEESLHRMSDLLAATGRLALVGGWQLDLQSGELLWTDETKRIHGVPPDYEPSVDTAIAFYASEARELIRESVAQASATGESWELEVPLIRADGKTIWVHAQGSAILEGGEPKLLYGAFQDITERRRLLQEVSQSRELMRVTLESIAEGVITTDASGRITWLNPVAERLTGWSIEDAGGLALDAVFRAVREQDRQPVTAPVERCLAERRIVTLTEDMLLISRDGQEYGIQDSAAPIVNEAGELLGAVMVFRDVTEQRRLTGEMRYRARHDSLTGLINRAEFESRLEQLLEQARDDGGEHAVLFIDLDQFKIVNDSCGHSVGDELLQRVAAIFRDAVRSQDTVARLGGDEFAMILEHCPSDHALRIAEAVCDRVREFRFVHGNQTFRIGASIGLVHLPGAGSDVSAVLQAADTACYAAKHAGRDRVHVYEAGDVAIVNQRSETRWATEIESALDEGRLFLFCQPIVPAGSGARDSAAPRLELLLRMKSQGGDWIVPGAFIPVAERFHMIGRIDRWVVGEALRWVRDPRFEAATLFVNLSGRSLGDRLFQDSVLKTLRQHDRGARERLVFEITETAVISNLVDVREFLEALQGLGVGIALDDFGSGMASYAYLGSLPLNYLKIDGQLIRTMLDDELALAAVRSFIDVASVLKVPTIAEHVENAEVAQALEGMGIGYLQGYHVGRPECIEP